MRQGLFHPFSLLLGVALSPVRATFCGNFAVFPQSHAKSHPLLRADGRLDGCDWSNAKRADDPWCTAVKLPGMGDATQLMLEPGDVIVAHPDLAHRGAPNYSPDIRYMVYFRLRHVALGEEHAGHDALARRLVTNMWADLEGMTAAAAATPLSLSPLSLPLLPPLADPDPHAPPLRVLSPEQVRTFQRDGYVVVPGIADEAQLNAALAGLSASLAQRGVDVKDLASTADALRALSSTGGAGGVLDLFYDEWKLAITLANRRYFDAITDLYGATYGSDAATRGSSSSLWAHPYGAFDATDAFAHVDRIGFRVPDAVNTADADAAALVGSSRSSRHGQRGLQRCLAPHLDCCPSAMHAGGGKSFPRWRPIQAMLSLTDTLAAECGGFEAVRGFHREFAAKFGGFAAAAQKPHGGQKRKEVLRSNAAEGKKGAAQRPRPHGCVGDFTSVRAPELLARMEHVAIPRGGAVFWDQRIPHASARSNSSAEARAVVYGGWLPRTAMNARFAAEQARRLVLGIAQSDFWLEEGEVGGGEEGGGVDPASLSDHARHVLGLD